MGIGKMYFERWTYMQRFGCYSFVYGGFRGNQNYFPTKIACKAACVDQGIPAVNKYVRYGADPRIDLKQNRLNLHQKLRISY